MSTIPAEYSSLVDDAALFPPGNAPLPEAVAAHRAHRRAAWAALVGPFVVSDVALPDLIEQVRADGGGPMAVAVVVTGGAGAVEPAVRWAARAEELELVAVELALRDEEDLPRNARRVTTVVDQLRAVGDLDDETPVYVEPPRPGGPTPPTSWLAALDEVAAADLRLKFRTGGVAAEAFPTPTELATCIDAALDRELRFKCTAGLHHALRHRVSEGFERPVDQHGFLNVLAATRAALDGGAADDVAAVLATTDASQVRDALATAGSEGLVSARRWFTSFGSCSVLEPLEDLVDLGLVEAAAVEEQA
ncbi:MAG TPA: hypothetical protein VFZ64_10445 [Nocardioidaceae bacterium]